MKKQQLLQQKHQVHNLIILDESGSMESIKTTIMNGFNELVQSIQGIEKQFPEQAHYVSFVSFNSLGTKLLHFLDPVSRLEQINAKHYCPNATTPLLDAMGFSLQKLRQALMGQSDYHVLVTILTDGEENASKEFTFPGIRKLVEELKSEKWTFTYIGADHDVVMMATSLSIDNMMVFEKDDVVLADFVVQEKEARVRYSERIKNKEEKGTGFYN